MREGSRVESFPAVGWQKSEKKETAGGGVEIKSRTRGITYYSFVPSSLGGR